MKNAKKLMALILTAVLVMAMGIGAMATEGGSGDSGTGEGGSSAASGNTITITGAKPGETYIAYKILDLSVDDPTNPQAYRYTVNSAWEGFLADATYKAIWDKVFTIDDQGYVTSTIGSETDWSATSDLSKFAEAAAKYAKESGVAEVDRDTVAEGDTEAFLETSEPGYYIVTSTLGTRAMVDTTPGDVEIKEKNGDDTIEKKVKEDSDGVFGESNDAQIGDTVEFESVVTIVPRSINVKIHDTMDNGLTFTAESIKIYTDSAKTTPLPASMYEIQSAPDTGDTFTIKIMDEFAATATTSQTLYVYYSAVLNENAVTSGSGEDSSSGSSDSSSGDAAATVSIVDQNNKAKITYGDDQSIEKETTTTTHKFSVFKHAKGKTEYLAGAVFSLKKKVDATSNESTVVKLTKIDNYNYRVDSENGSDTFVTVSDGDIVIWGVDADSDYALEEITPPAGYNKLPSEIDVTVNADNSTRVDVENSTGSELPSTGGIGTTLFYVIGGILVVGAGVLLVSRRRMK